MERKELHKASAEKEIVEAEDQQYILSDTQLAGSTALAVRSLKKVQRTCQKEQLSVELAPKQRQKGRRSAQNNPMPDTQFASTMMADNLATSDLPGRRKDWTINDLILVEKEKEVDEYKQTLEGMKEKHVLFSSTSEPERKVFGFQSRQQQQSSETLQKELKVSFISA